MIMTIRKGFTAVSEQIHIGDTRDNLTIIDITQKVMEHWKDKRKSHQLTIKCVCGNTYEIGARRWLSDKPSSCSTCSRNHGQSKTQLYNLVSHAKRRAKDNNLPFDITWRDLEIPDTCPLLGIPITSGNGKTCDTSPTIDRKRPELGYVKGNVWIISHKANRMKSDATFKEIQTFYENYYSILNTA